MCFVVRLRDNIPSYYSQFQEAFPVSVDCCVKVQRVTIHTGSWEAASAMSSHGLDARYLFKNVLVHLNKLEHGQKLIYFSNSIQKVEILNSFHLDRFLAKRCSSL